MIQQIINFFRKEDSLKASYLPDDKNEIFTLKLDDNIIGYLECEKGIWSFEYADKFKESTEFNLIIGFSNVNKVYKSNSLWPFFQIRIPGLKQPAVKEILKKEHIDTENEFALLKRFGFKSIANPYTLNLT